MDFVKHVNLFRKNLRGEVERCGKICKEAMFPAKRIVSPDNAPKLDSAVMILNNFMEI